jgi:hypothetical protein
VIAADVTAREVIYAVLRVPLWWRYTRCLFMCRHEPEDAVG